MAARYLLVADLNGRRGELWITADPPAGIAAREGRLAAEDFDATLQAIAHVMAQAHSGPYRNVWARGRVRLLDGERLIHEMPPKED